MLHDNTFNYMEETIDHLVNIKKPNGSNKHSVDINISFNNPDRCKIYQILDWLYHNTYYTCCEIVNDMVIFGYNINKLSDWEHYKDEIAYRNEIYKLEHSYTDQ